MQTCGHAGASRRVCADGIRRCRECKRVYLLGYCKQRKRKIREKKKAHSCGHEGAARHVCGDGIRRCRECKRVYDNSLKRKTQPQRYNAERSREKRRRLRAKFPDRYRLYERNNHHRRRSNKGTGTVTRAEWFEIKARYGFACSYCFEVKPLTMDHAIPLARGGEHAAHNIVPACVSCNSRKHTKTRTEFLAQLLAEEIARLEAQIPSFVRLIVLPEEMPALTQQLAEFKRKQRIIWDFYSRPAMKAAPDLVLC